MLTYAVDLCRFEGAGVDSVGFWAYTYHASCPDGPAISTLLNTTDSEVPFLADDDFNMSSDAVNLALKYATRRKVYEIVPILNCVYGWSETLAVLFAWTGVITFFFLSVLLYSVYKSFRIAAAAGFLF